MTEPTRIDYSNEEAMQQWTHAINTLSAFMNMMNPIDINTYPDKRKRLDLIMGRVRFHSRLFDQVLEHIEKES